MRALEVTPRLPLQMTFCKRQGSICERLMMQRYIYFIEAGEFVKIGFTNSIDVRLSALQVGSPHPLKVLCLVPGTRDDEKFLQRAFCVERYRGEWFYLTSLIRRCVEVLKSCESVSELPERIALLRGST